MRTISIGVAAKALAAGLQGFSSIESGRPLERGSENAISTLGDLAVLPGNRQTDRRHGH